MACRQVTACIKTLNNEKTIAECLSSVVPFVDEVIVFDTGSDDRTVAIAREYGARVFITENDSTCLDDDILGKVCTDWCFWLEPDYILGDATFPQIAELVKAQPKSSSKVTMRIEKKNLDQLETPDTTSLNLVRIPQRPEFGQNYDPNSAP